jgi:PST family polysaccharide transporter
MPTETKQDIAGRTRSSLKWNTSLKILSQVFRFVTTILLARLLDPVDFGILAIGHMVINYTNSLSDFGFLNALVQKKDLKQIHINSVFTLNLAISFLLFICIAAASSTIGLFFNSVESGRVLLFMSSLFILRTFKDVYKALLRRQVLFKAIAGIELFESFAGSILAVTLAYFQFRYWSLVCSTITATLFSSILFAFQVKDKPRIQYEHKAMKAIYGFGFWNFFRAQLFFINQYVTQLIVGKLFGPVSLGFFEKAHQLASTPRESIAMQINSVMFSSFSRLQNDTKLLREWFLKIILMETILVVPILCGLIAVADHFIIVVLGAKWAQSIVPLQILSIGVIFQILNGLLASLNVGTGQYRQQALREFPGTLLFLVLCIPLVKTGISGIACAYSISMVFIGILTFQLAKRSLTLNFAELIKPVAPYLLVNILMILLVQYLFHTALHDFTITNFILLVSSGALFYVGATAGVNLLLKRHIMFPLRNN